MWAAMRIRQIKTNKKRYLALLLLADEQEDMIDSYLARGQMFALYDEGLKTIAVVTDEGEGVCELKSLATVPPAGGRGMAGAWCSTFSNALAQPTAPCLSAQTTAAGTSRSIKTADFHLLTAWRISLLAITTTRFLRATGNCGIWYTFQKICE